MKGLGPCCRLEYLCFVCLFVYFSFCAFDFQEKRFPALATDLSQIRVASSLRVEFQFLKDLTKTLNSVGSTRPNRRLPF